VIREHNVSVWFNAVVRGDDDVITLGEGSQVQDGCVLHVDPGVPLTIGCNVSVGHKATLHGCTIEDGCLIGINSVVLNSARVGRNCLIGANTLISENKVIPEGMLVVGSPGKILRALTPQEIGQLGHFSAHYRNQARRYRAGLRADDD
jgi:carbonic anhydrase/acetyltransferase-like protein (isoleucine patch superfamily)